MATAILLVGGIEVIRDGQYLSGLGIGMVGTLYATSIIQIGLAIKQDTVAKIGLLSLLSAVTVYGVSVAASIPIFEISY